MYDIGKVSKKGCTAIVVDDDEDTVNLFAEFLEICDVRVLGKAFDGNQGVEMYKKILPDMVFSDVMMPGYDGFYLLQKNTPNQPIYHNGNDHRRCKIGNNRQAGGTESRRHNIQAV
ncbi:MAG: response regulator [Thaumarchaeota archaeon]|nr:response regulator [Nitrososphaerota archaeon]